MLKFSGIIYDASNLKGSFGINDIPKEAIKKNFNYSLDEIKTEEEYIVFQKEVFKFIKKFL